MHEAVFFRVDGNTDIGLGHVMRCLTIADALKERGARPFFVTSDEAPFDVIASHDFPCMSLSRDYRQKDATDAEAFLARMREEEARICFTDSYHIGNEYFRLLRSETRVGCINSIRERLEVDLLVNDNLACDKDYITSLYEGTDTMLLLGADFVPIRPSFLIGDYRVADVVRTVLITTGGADQTDVTGRFLEQALSDERFSSLRFVCVSGPLNTHLPHLQALAETSPQRVTVLHGVSDMAALMRDADLALSAGGTTVLELAVTGVPTVSFSSAADQIPGLLFMNEREMCLYAGEVTDEKFLITLSSHLQTLSTDVSLRKRLSAEARRHLDGQGAKRIAKALLAEDR